MTCSKLLYNGTVAILLASLYYRNRHTLIPIHPLFGAALDLLHRWKNPIPSPPASPASSRKVPASKLNAALAVSSQDTETWNRATAIGEETHREFLRGRSCWSKELPLFTNGITLQVPPCWRSHITEITTCSTTRSLGCDPNPQNLIDKVNPLSFEKQTWRIAQNMDPNPILKHPKSVTKLLKLIFGKNFGVIHLNSVVKYSQIHT